MPELAQRVSSAETPHAAAALPDSATADAQTLMGNAEIARQLALNDNEAPILFLGLNSGSIAESTALAQANDDRGGVVAIHDQTDQLTRDGAVFDLQADAGIEAFVAKLGLGADAAGAVCGLLAASKSRDETAQFIEQFAKAECGGSRLDRIVLSGHHIGGALFGDGGTLVTTEVHRIAEIFPLAAQQVRHIMIAGCFTGHYATIESYRKVFPGLVSMWAYMGSAPGAESGSITHLLRWEEATEEGDGTNVERKLANGTRKGEGVVTWNQEDGYQGVMPVRMEHIREHEAIFTDHFTGETEVADPQTGPLRDYYNWVQWAIGDGTNGSEDRWLAGRRDQTIRLLFWKSVLRHQIAAQYGAEIAVGSSTLGLGSPDLARMSRREFVALAGTVEKRARPGVSAPAVARAQTLLTGLRDLAPALIPEAWI